MSLQQTITTEMRESLKTGIKPRINALRYLVGEFSRGASKELTDAEVVKIIQKAVENERALANPDKAFIVELEAYIPTRATPNEIRTWIQQNVDLGSFKNRMQAIKPILAHFGTSTDGTVVKEILAGM
jgi:uncharacterized protein